MTTKLLALVCATLMVSGAAYAQGQHNGHGNHGAAKTEAAAKEATGTGVVRKVDAGKGVVNISHGPIPAINWPTMTMDFQTAKGVDLSGLKTGQQVEFTLKQDGSNYIITGVKPKG